MSIFEKAVVIYSIQNLETLVDKLEGELENFNPDFDWESFDLYSHTGGNIDECYDLGVEDGRQEMAYEILQLLKSGCK